VLLKWGGVPENQAKIDARQGKTALIEGNFDSENRQGNIRKRFI
jgi:hypothetical protein